MEWLLPIAALGLTLAFHPGPVGPAGDTVVAVLAFAMGLRNALIRTHGVPDLATNAMTLTSTALVAASVTARGRHERWERRAASIGIFMASATLVAFLTSRWGPSAPIAAAVLIYGVGLTAVSRCRAPKSEQPLQRQRCFDRRAAG